MKKFETVSYCVGGRQYSGTNDIRKKISTTRTLNPFENFNLSIEKLNDC